jgi:tRNA modification GTPase
MSKVDAHVTVVTAANPGAIGLIQITGLGTTELLTKITGIAHWQPNELRLTDFGDIDHGMALLMREDWAQLMPHGGPRVMQLIVDRLLESGGRYEPSPPTRDIYPEAQSDLEADMLAVLADAASPAAINLLLEQPRLWQGWFDSPDEDAGDILARSDRWDRLIHPLAVVVAGPPNVGKSTLTNYMLGRTASVVADLPGTTRDWVGGIAGLGSRVSGIENADTPYPIPDTRPICVRWLDTPGIRQSDDPIEQDAIKLAWHAIEAADVLIAMRDPKTSYPDLPRDADIHVVNKSDLLETPATDGLPISALHGNGIDQLEAAIIDRLELGDTDRPALWAFTSALRNELAK